VGYFEADATIMAEPPQRSDTSFRRRFAELSLEKKLSIFFVPVFAAVVGTLVPRFLGGDGGGGASPDVSVVIDQRTEERAENLQPVSLATSNTPEAETAEIEVIVRNTGMVDSVIHSAEFRVVEFAAAETCYVPEGQLDVSGRYDLVLPTSDGGGKTFDVDLQQSIPAAQADRFSFTVQVRGDVVPTVPRLYALDVLLYHDQAEEPLDAGTALVAVPFPLWDAYVYPGTGPYGGYFDPECPARNAAQLKDFLAVDGARSDELEQFAADPEAFLQFDPKPLPAPTDADIERATATASELVANLAAGRFREACDSFDPESLRSIMFLVEMSCSELVSQFADLLPAGSGDSLEVTNAEPGWMRIVAPEGDGGRQLVIVLQRRPHQQAGTPKQVDWVVTNLYDAADGPLDLSGEGSA
jgi:hypothetical protein